MTADTITLGKLADLAIKLREASNDADALSKLAERGDLSPDQAFVHVERIRKHLAPILK